MRLWLSRPADDADWPRDPQLDPFREAVWELSQDGNTVGWLTTSISPMRATPAVWVKREEMLARVHWIDGAREDLEEDYGPKWYVARELFRGIFETTNPRHGPDAKFAAKPVIGVERYRLWTDLKHSE